MSANKKFMTPSSTPINTTLKIVVDTNQFLSVFVFRGQLMKLVFELVLDEKIDLYVSPALKDEVLEKLNFFGVNTQIQNDVMSFIDEKGILVTPTVQVDVSRDPEDNFMMELAEEAQADYLITRDKDLLEIHRGEWKDTKIIRPEEFLSLLRSLQLI